MCKEVDKCGQKHDDQHLSDAECDEKRSCPYRADFRDKYGGKDYPRHRECLLRWNQVKCLQGILKRKKELGNCLAAAAEIIKWPLSYITTSCADMKLK
jgi:hypothetical protein